MRWQDIASLSANELNKLDSATLRKYTTQMVSAANKRLRNLRDKGLVTPASAVLDGGKFSTPRKTNLNRIEPDKRRAKALQDVNRLREELSRVKRFMQNETSTLKGYERFQDKQLARLLGETPLTDEEMEKETPKQRRDRRKRERERRERFENFNWNTFNIVIGRVKHFQKSLDSTRVRKIVIETIENSYNQADVETIVQDATEKLERAYKEKQDGGSTDGYKRVM